MVLSNVNRDDNVSSKYSIGQMAEKLGITVKTLQNWDNRGKLKAYRTPTNQRFYTENQYLKIMGENTKSKRLVVAYSRVSTRNQRDDLKDQIKFIQQFLNAKGIILDKSFTDIGSGLNYKRRNWNKLLDLVMANKIKTIYITYKDRFIRFGYDWFNHLCNKHGTNIIVLNDKATSSTEEVAQDVLSILHVFSCRLYGLRKYKNKIKDDKVIKKEEKEN